MPLSCISHIKRRNGSNNNGGIRPKVPGVAVLTEFCLDRSGSMHTFNGAQHEATRQLFAQQKESAEESGVPHYLTVTTFDDHCHTYLDNVDASLAEPPTDKELSDMCDPRGTTKLFDTALQGVKRLQKRAREWYDSKSSSYRSLVDFDQVTMTFMLFTDGHDNASQLDPRGEMLCEGISEFRKVGGNAIFMAANQDACVVGANLGFSADSSLTVGSTPEYAQAAFKGVTQMLRAVSSGESCVSVPKSLRQSSCAPTGQGGNLGSLRQPNAPSTFQQNTPNFVHRNRQAYYNSLHQGATRRQSAGLRGARLFR